MASVEASFSVESDHESVFSGSAYYSSETSASESDSSSASKLSGLAWMEVMPYLFEPECSSSNTPGSPVTDSVDTDALNVIFQ